MPTEKWFDYLYCKVGTICKQEEKRLDEARNPADEPFWKIYTYHRIKILCYNLDQAYGFRSAPTFPPSLAETGSDL